MAKRLRTIKENDLVRTNLGRRFYNASLADLAGLDQHHAVATRRYCENLDEMISKGVGLLFWGDNSRGKTHDASIIAIEALKACKTVLVVTASELRDAYMPQGEQTIAGIGEPLISRARKVDVLVIDDIGKEWKSTTGYVQQVFENLVRFRTRELKVLIMTTNLIPTAFAEAFGRAMTEMLRESVIQVKVEGDNRRSGAIDQLEKKINEH